MTDTENCRQVMRAIAAYEQEQARARGNERTYVSGTMATGTGEPEPVSPAEPETARRLAEAQEAVRVMAGALGEVAEHRAECHRCEGTGLDPPDTMSACSECGGQGRTLHATGALSTVEAALAHPAVVALMRERDEARAALAKEKEGQNDDETI